MMTPEEVLEHLQKQKKALDGYPSKFIYVGLPGAFFVISGALKKQIRIKPINEPQALGRGFIKTVCPICKHDLEKGLCRPYCSNCGQAIDWRE